jgi:hypothetical protein
VAVECGAVPVPAGALTVDRLRDRQKPGKKMMGDMIPILSVLVQSPVNSAAGPLVPHCKGEKHTNWEYKRNALCRKNFRVWSHRCSPLDCVRRWDRARGNGHHVEPGGKLPPDQSWECGATVLREMGQNPFVRCSSS